jgi:hypothetical protein
MEIVKWGIVVLFLLLGTGCDDGTGKDGDCRTTRDRGNECSGDGPATEHEVQLCEQLLADGDTWTERQVYDCDPADDCDTFLACLGGD